MTDGQFNVEALKSVDLGNPPPDPNAPPAPPPPPVDPNNPAPPPPVDPAAPPAPPPVDPNNPAPPPPPVDPNAPPAPPPPAKTAEEITKDARAAFLKEMGFTSEEELKAFKEKQTAAQETPEQKEKRERQYAADLDAYVVKNEFLKKEDLVSLENLKKQTPEQIVFQDFAASYKTKNPEANDETIQSEFRSLYHLDSSVAGVKEFGEGLLKQKADQIKGALEGKYNEAKTKYDSTVSDQSRVPAFRQMVKQNIEQYVPARIDLFKIGEDVAGLDIKPEWKEEVEKAFVNKETFEEFKNLPPAQMAEKMKERVDAFLFVKHRQEILSAVAEHFLAIGKKAGKVGAEAPFTQRGNEASIPVLADSDKDDLKKSDARLAGLGM